MKIAIIGAGNMGGAIALGALRRGVVKVEDMCCADQSDAILEKLNAEFPSLTTTKDNVEAIKGADVVVLAVKPWILPIVVEQIKGEFDASHQMVVSIAAGITTSDIEEFFGAAPAMFRVMPNTAIEVAESMTLISAVNASAEQIESVRQLFAALGKAVVIEERLMAAGTSLASCGIAFAMRYVRAAMEGGVEMGFYPTESKEIVLQTIRGAVELLQQTGEHPEAAIDKVTTPGGITIKGLNEMDHANFNSAVIRALKASK